MSVLRRSPFTLVEVMMAVLILGTAVVILMRVVTNSLHQLDRAQEEVFVERAIYEALAADALATDEEDGGGELEDLEVQWGREESEGSLNEELVFKRMRITLESERLEAALRRDEDSDDEDDEADEDTFAAEEASSAIVIERID